MHVLMHFLVHVLVQEQEEEEEEEEGPKVRRTSISELIAMMDKVIGAVCHRR